MKKIIFLGVMIVLTGGLLAREVYDFYKTQKETVSGQQGEEIMEISNASEYETQNIVEKDGYTAIRCDNCADANFSYGIELIDKIRTNQLDSLHVGIYTGLDNICISERITLYKDDDFIFVVFEPSGGMSQLHGGEMYSADGGDTWYIRNFHRVCQIGDMYIMDGKIMTVEGIGMADIGKISISYDYGETYQSCDCSSIEQIMCLPGFDFSYPRVESIDLVNDKIGIDWMQIDSSVPFYHMEVSISAFQVLEEEDLCGLGKIAAQYQEEGYFFKESNTAYLDKTAVRERYASIYTATQNADTTARDIRYAINEIYAKKGYDFTGSDYEYYFFDREWYKPIQGKVVREEELNQFEKANIDFLVSLEKEYQRLASGD